MTMTFEQALMWIYIGSSVFAIYKGYRIFFVLLALCLALVFQNILGYSDIAKVIVAVIFVLYFVFPTVVPNLKYALIRHRDRLFNRVRRMYSRMLENIKQYLQQQWKVLKAWLLSPFGYLKNAFTRSKQTSNEEQQQRSKRSAGGNSSSGKSFEEVFEDFQSFTKSRSKQRKQDADGAKGKEESTSSQRKSKYRQQSSGKSSRSESSRPSHRAKQTNPKKLVEEVQQLQMEKERLAIEKRQAEQRQKEAETRLQQEQQARKRDQEKIRELQSRQGANDTRSDYEILGVPSSGFTAQELKLAWMREVKRWHTDTMKNKPEELRELAEAECAKVNRAYENLKKLL